MYVAWVYNLDLGTKVTYFFSEGEGLVACKAIQHLIDEGYITNISIKYENAVSYVMGEEYVPRVTHHHDDGYEEHSTSIDPVMVIKRLGSIYGDLRLSGWVREFKEEEVIVEISYNQHYASGRIDTWLLYGEAIPFEPVLEVLVLPDNSELEERLINYLIKCLELENSNLDLANLVSSLNRKYGNDGLRKGMRLKVAFYKKGDNDGAIRIKDFK